MPSSVGSHRLPLKDRMASCNMPDFICFFQHRDLCCLVVHSVVASAQQCQPCLLSAMSYHRAVSAALLLGSLNPTSQGTCKACLELGRRCGVVEGACQCRC